jgi:hypothetical protein
MRISITLMIHTFYMRMYMYYKGSAHFVCKSRLGTLLIQSMKLYGFRDKYPLVYLSMSVRTFFGFRIGYSGLFRYTYESRNYFITLIKAPLTTRVRQVQVYAEFLNWTSGIVWSFRASFYASLDLLMKVVLNMAKISI